MRESAPNLLDFYGKPSQMAYWSDIDNLIDFLNIQSYFHHIGSSPQISPIAVILDECIEKLAKVKNETT